LILNYEILRCSGFAVALILEKFFFSLTFMQTEKNANAIERLPFLQCQLRFVRSVFLHSNSPFSLPDIPTEELDIFLFIKPIL
jgi:hypothetical protein